MKTGVTFIPHQIDDLVQKAKLAEDHGFDFVGIADSQSIARELYVSLTNVALETDTIQLGSTVTNPVTRHPVVAISAVCAIDELSDGRVFLGLGSGDSALYTLGEEPARLAEMEDCVRLFQALSRGGEYEYRGHEVRLKWLQEEGESRDVPVFLTAEGPKTLQLAGAVADGVFIGTGLFPELIRESVDKVNQGAREAGRDPADVEKWVFAKTNIAEDREEAVDEIKMALAASANHAFRFTLEGKRIPEEYREPIEELKANYVPHEHEQLGPSANRKLVERLGLTDYLADRFAVVGTPDECLQKLREIESVDGVEGVLMTAITEDETGFVEQMGSRVVSKL